MHLQHTKAMLQPLSNVITPLPSDEPEGSSHQRLSAASYESDGTPISFPGMPHLPNPYMNMLVNAMPGSVSATGPAFRTSTDSGASGQSLMQHTESMLQKPSFDDAGSFSSYAGIQDDEFFGLEFTGQADEMENSCIDPTLLFQDKFSTPHHTRAPR
jgi:hypothetical protein